MQKLSRRRLLGVAVLLTVGMGIFLFKVHFDLQRGARELTEARIEREALRTQRDELRRQLSYMQTDEYIMQVARSDLGLILPGEYRYVTE